VERWRRRNRTITLSIAAAIVGTRE